MRGRRWPLKPWLCQLVKSSPVEGIDPERCEVESGQAEPLHFGRNELVGAGGGSQGTGVIPKAGSTGGCGNKGLPGPHGTLCPLENCARNTAHSLHGKSIQPCSPSPARSWWHSFPAWLCLQHGCPRHTEAFSESMEGEGTNPLNTEVTLSQAGS